MHLKINLSHFIQNPKCYVPVRFSEIWAIFKYVLVLCGAILILGGKYAKHNVDLQGIIYIEYVVGNY
jgi:hypothetical protein